MVPRELRPQTVEEHIVHWSIVSTWAIWLIGGLYVFGSLLAYVLLALQVARLLGRRNDPARLVKAPTGPVLAWVIGMIAMQLALLMAHADFGLGLVQTLKSSVGWAKGWALLALYIGIGATMSVRPAVLARACSILAVQTLILVPIFIAAKLVGAPKLLYVSPLHILLGASPEFFDVTLYHTDETSGAARWRFFAPWATAAAFYAGLALFIAYVEKSIALRAVCILSALLVCMMSGSRLSVVALPVVAIAVAMMSRMTSRGMWLAFALAATIAVVFAPNLIVMYEDATDTFNSARAASSRVRAALGNIAVHRWLAEAPVFGHGILERGGQVVERMLVGSHHTWWGLLFVKGAVGFAALAIPLAWSFVDLLLKAQTDRVARAALGALLSVLLFSFADNVEIVAYLVWPALILIGIAHGRRLCHPGARYLGGPAAA